MNFTEPRAFTVGRWAILSVFTLCWYVLVQGASHLFFHVVPDRAAIPGDLAAHLLFAALCFGLSGRLRRTLPAVAAFTAALNLCNAGKIQFFGTPVMPDDLLTLGNLFLLLTGWQLAGAVAVIAVPLCLLLVMIDWRRPRVWLLLGLCGLCAWGLSRQAGPAVAKLDAAFKNSVWDQRGNFESRGVFIHLLQEGLRYRARGGSVPATAEVEAALAVLGELGQGEGAAALKASPGNPRNVHMLVLESFWDAALLSGSELSMDPVDPRFRELWRQAGNSHALSPVFGGFTANAEFEALCGFPVTEDHVLFETGLKNDVACLPRVLAGAGYRSIASHPNVAGFWNRVNAYRRVGFTSYWSDRDFVLDDLNGEFLSDASLYRQTMEKIAATGEERPVFNYLLTYFGHVAYPLNAARPAVITTSDKNALLNAYVNLMYYKSRELMDFLEKLRRDDPDALIILFGDHLPFLGPGFYGFLRSNLLSGNRAEMSDAMVRTLTATPLVIIDGRRGPVAAGDLPMYRLPALVLDLLGLEARGAMRWSVAPPGWTVRPLPGMFWAGRSGTSMVCRAGQPGSDACGDIERWLQATVTVARDLFSGRQLALRDGRPPRQGAAAAE